MPSRAVTVVLLATQISCLDATQATLELTTNVACGDETAAADTFFEAGIVAGPPASVADGELQTTTRTCVASDDELGRIGSIVLYPRDGAEAAGVLVIGTVGDISAEDCLSRLRGGGSDLAGCIVARRTIAFVPNQNLAVPVFLDARCEGVSCPEDETCVFADGRPRCVPADVHCEGTDCDVGQGAGGAGGAGGGPAGTGGAGGGPGDPVFEPLPLPVGLDAAQAMGVSEDGAVVVGLGRVGADTHPVVWRDGQAHVLGMATGTVSEACGAGDIVVGHAKTSVDQATAWQWNESQQTHAVLWTLDSALATFASDCSVTGDRILTTGNAGGFAIHSLGSQTALDAEQAGAFALSSNGAVVVGIHPTTFVAGYWPLSPSGQLSPVVGLSTGGGIAHAVNAQGTLVAAAVGSELVVYEIGVATPVFTGATDFIPSAIAGDATTYIVVGSCDTFVTPRACVVVSGEGPFDVDGIQGTPWSTTGSTDFAGLGLTVVSDVSADGKVLVGWGVEASTNRQLAFRLTRSD